MIDEDGNSQGHLQQSTMSPMTTKNSSGNANFTTIATTTTTVHNSCSKTKDNEKRLQRHNLDNITNRSSSLELILTPIIQSRR